MRKIECSTLNAANQDAVMEEFNERREEFGIHDEDIISMTLVAALSNIKIHNPKGPALDPKVTLVVFHWAREHRE